MGECGCGCSKKLWNHFKVYKWRFWPICTAAWIIIDFVLDILQTKEYHDRAFGGEVNYTTKDNLTVNYHISPGYFYAACAIWVLPAVLISVITLLHDCIPLATLFRLLKKKQDCFKNHCCCALGAHVILIPTLFCLDLIVSAVANYILFPLLALRFGKGRAEYEKKRPEDQEHVGIRGEYDVPFGNAFSNLFEALPQLITLIWFTLSHEDFLLSSQGEAMFTWTIIKMVFSVGTLAWTTFWYCQEGTYKDLCVIFKCIEPERAPEHPNENTVLSVLDDD